ncbi:glutaredoxin-C6-like isoform X1 [Vigna umbellata]|uniref:glutaredoxin-C6-like isoform X1 n=1 Tax=Vigna umbellata TaxID=87088 RepID=UPI001F5F2E38|nr:glutaredoxin-C6-like isoform X1 [Vigna umbellata]
MQGLRRCSNDVVHLDLTTPTPATTNSSTTSSSSSLSIDVEESTEARIQRLISEHPVIIFTRSSCCMCHVMKKLLATIGVNPTVIELDDHEIAALPDATRTPAVFIGGASVGGLESLVALHVSGHLVPKLVQVGALWNSEKVKSPDRFKAKTGCKDKLELLSSCQETTALMGGV